MNSKNKFLYFFSLVLIFLTTSCHKENVAQKSKMELLTGTRWQFYILLYEQPPGSTPIDYSSGLFLQCELDDIFQFKQDGSFISSQNTIMCNPSHTDVLTYYDGGGWSLSQGDTLDLTAGLNKQTFLLSSITTTDLELKQTSADYFQNLYTYRFQFKATP